MLDLLYWFVYLQTLIPLEKDVHVIFLVFIIPRVVNNNMYIT